MEKLDSFVNPDDNNNNERNVCMIMNYNASLTLEHVISVKRN